MDVRIERLERWRRGETAPPVRIEAELTDRCNLRCIFCWQRNETFPRAVKARSGPDPRELPDAEWLRLVEESVALGAREWHICGGGEPLIRRELALQMMERIKAGGMNGLLTTNGTLLNAEAAQRIVAAGWDMVEISMESAEPLPNDFLRGSFSFARAVRGLELLNRVKQERGAVAPRLEIAAVLCRQNYDLLPDLMSFAAERGCAKLSVNPIVTPPGAPRTAVEQRLSGREIAALPRAIVKAREIARRAGLETNVNDFLAQQYVEKTDRFDEVIADGYRETPADDPFRGAHCFIPWGTMAIRPDGLVGPCVAFRYGEGADVRGAALADIWTGPYFSEVRAMILRREPPDYCARCCAPFLIDGETTRKRLAPGKRTS